MYSTPIYQMKFNEGNNVYYIKRDDLLSFSFGGNKFRKAVLFFDDMKLKGADCVVTYGTSSSNHCRVVANLAKAKHIPCYIISPIEASKSTANSKMIKQLFGAKITMCPVSDVSITIDKKLKELKVKGYKPYFIQGGGHGNIGTQAYVNAYQEIIEYEKAKGMYFDYIFHATGTGTTQAGLICGNIIAEGNKKIIGISIARKNPRGGKIVLDSVNAYLKTLNRQYIFDENINFIDDYIFNGYGHYNDGILETIKDIMSVEGIPLDTTYTGKAFWGMREHIKKKQVTGKKILFLHTGGTPLFFDDLGEMSSE